MNKLQEILLPKDFKVGDYLEVYEGDTIIKTFINNIVDEGLMDDGGSYYGSFKISYFDTNGESWIYMFSSLKGDENLGEQFKVFGYRQSKIVEIEKLLSLWRINRMGLKNVKGNYENIKK